MKKLILRGIAVASLSVAVLWAADFWEKKGYTDWSEKEVKRVLTNSPWSQKVTVYMSGGRGGGGDFDYGGFGGGGRGGGGGDFGGGGPGGGAPSMTVFVRWFSALPVKQAMVKAEYGSEAGSAKKGLDYLARQENHYIVTVAGLPARMAGVVQRDPDGLKQNTVLKHKKKELVNPDDVQVRGQEQLADFYFLFPKTDKITLDDKDVEFVMKTQRFEIKRKFKLKNMVYNGELSL